MAACVSTQTSRLSGLTPPVEMDSEFLKESITKIKGSQNVDSQKRETHCSSSGQCPGREIYQPFQGHTLGERVVSIGKIRELLSEEQALGSGSSPSRQGGVP